MAQSDPDLEQELASFIQREVAAGFEDRGSIAETVFDVFREEMDSSELERLVPRFLDDAIAAHRLAQSSWPLVTDCDRLDAAFLALEEIGVISRQNYSCCQTCGTAEIWDELNKAADEGRNVVGYTFYHVQDTESAVEDSRLHLSYGALEEGDAASVDIGHRIAAVLRKSGLTTDWNGHLSQRIAVSLDWKRRRAD